MKDKRVVVLLVKVHTPNCEHQVRDDIRTKSSTQSYRDGWDAINWGKTTNTHIN